MKFTNNRSLATDHALSTSVAALVFVPVVQCESCLPCEVFSCVVSTEGVLSHSLSTWSLDQLDLRGGWWQCGVFIVYKGNPYNPIHKGINANNY